MSDIAIKLTDLGKMYKLYRSKKDKILDAFGLRYREKSYYDEFWALRHIDLEIPKGRRIGLIGNNGAGKSTLLKTIIGNLTPTEGTVEVNGNIQALMELGTAFHPEFTGRQNIHASLSYMGLSDIQIRSMEEEIIDFAELEEFINQPIRTYSAGMNARLSFSVATSISPDILIIDEILGAGDAYFAGKCVERMKKITDDSGATVIFVSHDLNSVLQLCDEVIWVDRGCFRLCGEPLYVVKEYNAEVRRRESIRLKAKTDKAGIIPEAQSIEEKHLFRLMLKDPTEALGLNRIYKIALTYHHDMSYIIELGAPMDNDEGQDCYIITKIEQTNWGLPDQSDGKPFRKLLQSDNPDASAPFRFPINNTGQKDIMKLEIECSLQNELLIQAYFKSEYMTVGVLQPSENSRQAFNYGTDFQQRMPETNQPKNQADISAAAEKYQYGNRRIIIEKVTLTDRYGSEIRVFELYSPMTVTIWYNASEEIPAPVFVFCIYLADGRCASQWFAYGDDYGRTFLNSYGRIVFEVDKLLLGKGSYVCSVGIFADVSLGKTAMDSYHVIDRSIFFEIQPPVNDVVEKGLCLQDYHIRLIDQN
jgi:lipopolysaccharide transport system ATP-binding protein